MGSLVTIPAKVDSTTIPITVDFISQLVTGEALVSAEVTISVFSGVDAAADDLLSGVATLAQNTITQTITGGVAGVVYLLSFNGTTNFGNSVIIQGYLAITTLNPFQA
jgi:hypothetical protein